MNFIEDNLKKESKRVLLTFILCYIAALIFPLLYYIDYDMDDILFFSILFFVMGCYSLFGFIYILKYQVSISQETITIKTLFKKIEIHVSDIETYTYKRYNGSSILYAFKFIVAKKMKTLITRYKDELLEFLNQNQIAKSSN